MAREEREKGAMQACDNAGADSNARIHCGQTWKALGLSSFKFQCELVGRRAGGMTHEWGVVLLHSCAPLLTLLLRRADTHAPACPLDLEPLAPYALHSVRLLPSPAVSIMIMISIPHPALLAPRASRSLVLPQLELFRSCSHLTFRRAHPL
ncbi:hypothetical protein B0H13DRAFT_2317754 [Mycena leptocephala]|nr:hypothetical protein B0H13DRAFT_2317754 [Mycena leptocephala]